ncbi:hypothetical protein SAMN05421882_101124 [Nitrosomonas communis]|uniref:Uncharacterized protein n=1 Tax=Nitrosomonas communis TaxID=44574 RepID=A0A1H2TI79_9PROT|nr:hypothetical protein SAMN05421882_101124 [Nitrosomonas communis]
MYVQIYQAVAYNYWFYMNSSGYDIIIPFLNQNRLCRLHFAVLFILSAVRLRVIFDLEMELDDG